MADADGKMKDLSISETKKNKKDGTPKTAAKKPQQQKKKVRRLSIARNHWKYSPSRRLKVPRSSVSMLRSRMISANGTSRSSQRVK